MPQHIDYAQVDIPEDKSPTAYHYTERRAEILDLVLRAGGPGAINQSSLAERYDVDRSTISRDLKRLSDAISDRLGRHLDLTVKAMFESTVSELRDAGDHKAAWDVAMDYADWLADRGAVETAPTEIEHRGAIAHAEVELDDDVQSAIRDVLETRRSSP